jgi:hypoxanthine phosphoribosyltransferase
MLNEITDVQSNAECLRTQADVEAALDQMAQAINDTLADSNLLVLCVLNGGIIVTGLLLPRLTMPLTLDSVSASRYQNKTSGGLINWLLKPSTSMVDRTVLIIDDVLDEGITLAAIKDYCLEHGARAALCAVLVDKNLGRKKPIQADFVGITVDDRYLFGYGMDYKGYLRNAAGIYACSSGKS